MISLILAVALVIVGMMCFLWTMMMILSMFEPLLDFFIETAMMVGEQIRDWVVGGIRNVRNGRN